MGPVSGLIEDHAGALAFLDARIGHGVKPGLERIEGLLDLMTRPQEAVPAIHVAGTNGKTTTVAMIRDLLLASGVRTGTFTSPHLQRVEERFTIDGRELTEAGLTAAVADVAPFVEIYEAQAGEHITYFELNVATAYQLFAAEGVEAAVVEVGLGGRWDATNVVEADVSVITGIAMDHMSYLGNSISSIAGEKAAILKSDGRLVTGPLPPAAEGAITARVAETGAHWFRHGADFALDDVVLGLGGWHGTIRGLHRTYEDVYVALHGRHQIDHFATAVAACEVFFDQALVPEVVAEVGAAMRSPGRLEVVRRRPLVIVDGSHNEQGLQGLAAALDLEFPRTRRVLVIGIRGERDLRTLLRQIEGRFAEVVATQAADPESIPAADVAAASVGVFGPDVPVDIVTPVPRAVAAALSRVAETEMVVVAGSLYVVGEARAHLDRGAES
jgi:dihydrofolate synthase/folylpolyglutamate synthase